MRETKRHREPIGVVGAVVVQEDVLDAENAALFVERHLVVNVITLAVVGMGIFTAMRKILLISINRLNY